MAEAPWEIKGVEHRISHRWNLDVAIFLFAVVIIVIILSFQGIRIEIVAPIAIFGLAMAWLVGWRQGRQLYERFYAEELSAGEIVVTCAWCGKEMRRERGNGQSIASHGICPECVQKNFPETLTAQIDRRGRKDDSRQERNR